MSARGVSLQQPFPGLRPFGNLEKSFFFGRGAQYFALYRLLNLSRFLAVIGNSGSGKSSLVRAGLRPLLEEEASEANGRRWLWMEIRPGDEPLAALEKALAALGDQLATTDDEDIAERRRDRISYHLRSSSQGVAKAIVEMDEVAGRPLVLLVDQFEELFRFASSAQSAKEDARQRDEAANFVQLLLEASRSPLADIHVMITLRSDFIGDCARFQGLPEAVSATQFLVPSMTRDQREEVIRGPIELVGATIDATLVEQLLNDSGAEIDQLPVLQHTLLRVWDEAGKRLARQGSDGAGQRHVLLEDYKAIGQMSGALSKHADEILGSDLAGMEPLVARVFSSLSDTDRNGRATRRAIMLGQLAAETAIAQPDLVRIVDRLRADDCSFLTPSPAARPTLDEATRIDVGHEALLRHWEKVAGVPGATGERGDTRPIGWLKEEERDGQRFQVLQAMAIGEEGGEAAVLSSEQYNRYWPWWNERPRTAAWAERHGGGHAEVVRLLEDSGKALAREGRKRKLAQVTEVAAVIFAVLLVAAVSGGVFIWQQYSAARQAELVAREAEQLARSDGAAAREAERKANAIAVTAFKGLEVMAAQIRRGLTDGFLQATVARDILLQISRSLPAVTVKETPPSIVQTKVKLLLDVSDLLSNVGERSKAMEQAEAALVLAESLVAYNPDNREWKRLVYSSSYRIGEAMLQVNPDDAGTMERAQQYYAKALVPAQELLAGEPDRVDRIRDLAFIHNKIGEAHQIGDDFSSARDQFQIALDLYKRAAAIDPARSGPVATTEVKIGDVLLLMTPPATEEALDHYSNALVIHQSLADNAPNSSTAVSNLAITRRGMGDALVRRARDGDIDAALDHYRKAVGLLDMLHARDSEDSRWMLYLGSLHRRLSMAHEKNGDVVQALEECRIELVFRDKLVARDGANKTWAKNAAESRIRLAELEARQPPPSPAPVPDDSQP